MRWRAFCIEFASAGAPWPTPRTAADAATLFNNLYFLAMTAIIALAACHYTRCGDSRSFGCDSSWTSNNRQLATTVRKLQETEVQLVQSEKMNAARQALRRPAA